MMPHYNCSGALSKLNYEFVNTGVAGPDIKCQILFDSVSDLSWPRGPSEHSTDSIEDCQ